MKDWAKERRRKTKQETREDSRLSRSPPFPLLLLLSRRALCRVTKAGAYHAEPRGGYWLRRCDFAGSKSAHIVTRDGDVSL